jgi:hypothetical protein
VRQPLEPTEGQGSARAALEEKRPPSPRERPAPVATGAPTPPSAPSVAADPPAGSPVGLGFGRVLVQLEGPRAKVTDQAIETVSGKIIGGAPEQLALYVNGVAREVVPDGRSFQVSVALEPGLNHLRAVATDPRGLKTEDAITVEYVPRAASNGIAIMRPRDGLTLTPDDPPIIIVEGEVEEKGSATIWLVANERRIAVQTREGRFRHILPILDPVLRLWAESPSNGTPAHRSEAVMVHALGPRTPTGILVMEWPQDAAGIHVEVSASWRARPDRLDGPVHSVPLKAFRDSPNGGPSEVFYLRNLKPGVYTFTLRYRASSSTGGARPTLYLPGSGSRGPRALRAVALNGAGRAALARVLLPHGVLWEQDEWFSGKSESVDTMTKFRFPEGISWVEWKADLP